MKSMKIDVTDWLQDLHRCLTCNPVAAFRIIAGSITVQGNFPATLSSSLSVFLFCVFASLVSIVMMSAWRS